MRKLTLLVAMLAMVLAAAVPAMAQDPAEAKIEGGPKAKAEPGKAAEAVVSEDVKAKAEPGKAEAKAGGAEAKAAEKAEAKAGGAEAKAGKAEAKAEAPKAEAKAEAPKAEAKAEAKALPKTGGSGTASLLALGAGALLVGGGLLARRFAR